MLVVQHGDCLDRLNRMIIDHNGKASRLPLLVPLELHSNYSTCQAEYLETKRFHKFFISERIGRTNLLQLSFIYCIVHVGHEYPRVQRALVTIV